MSRVKRLLLLYLGLLIIQLVHAVHPPLLKRFAHDHNFLFLQKFWRNIGYIFLCVFITWPLLTSKLEVSNCLFGHQQMSFFSLHKIPKFLLISWCANNHGNFPHNFGKISQNCAETANFHRILTPGNYVEFGAILRLKRGVFRTLSNINNGTVRYFCKKAPSYIFAVILNISF